MSPAGLCYPLQNIGITIVGVDPGKSSGLSIFREGKLDHYEILPQGFKRRLKRISSLLHEDSSKVVVFQETWSGGKFVKPSLYVGLGKEAGILLSVWDYLGIDNVFEVFPATWQSKMVRHKEKQNKKKKSQLVVYDLLGLELKDDIADAVLIAMWGAQSRECLKISSSEDKPDPLWTLPSKKR